MEAGAALRCGVEEEKMVTAALPEHTTRLAHLLCLVRIWGKNYSLPHLLLFLQTLLSICVVRPEMKHSPPYPG